MSETNQSDFAMPTMGGKQFWSDELFFHKWRIQRNVFTGHYRLLDAQDRRHASGTYEQCREALDDIKIKQGLAPMKGKAVIVLHGLFRSRNSMDSLCDYLAEQGGYEVFNMTYPSTRDDIGEHARSLGHVIDNLDGVEEVNFVGHSMGNIVIRYYFGDLRRQEAENNQSSIGPENAWEDKQRKGDSPIFVDTKIGTVPKKRPAFHRFVMLAPPNHEAQMATAFGDNIVFKTVSGQSGQQLGRQWKELERNLAAPDCEFGIIAGGKNNDKGYNPLLSGDNDGTISVETAKLPGASDFIVLPVLHTFIMNDAKVQELTLQYLQKGYFISEAQRHRLDK
ncbi:MAG: alpha/beta hydrolase [Thermoguttaceae bacterium]|jgi:pimeloyl-ACP methyl ester carboxylesterase